MKMREVILLRNFKPLFIIFLLLLLPFDHGSSEELLIGFGSCLHQDFPQPIWKEIKAQKPSVFIMLGDNVYGDTNGDILRLEQAYQNQTLALKKAELNFPVLAIWDDHDYGKNDGGNEYRLKEESKKLFLNFWNIPADDRRHDRQGLYFQEIIHSAEGTVQILMLDTRYFRSALKQIPKRNTTGVGRYVPDYDPAKTMLGQAQWKWLKNSLNTEVDFRILGTSIQLIAEGHGWERWGNLPLERHRLLELLANYSITNLVVISGDRHMGGIYKIRISEGFELLEMTSSSMNLPNWISNEPGPLRIEDNYVEENFGLIRINFKRRMVRIELHGLDNGVVRSAKLNF